MSDKGSDRDVTTTLRDGMLLMRDHEDSETMEIADDVMNWMKTHTLRDLKEIALEMEERGDDTEGVWEFIEELRGIQEEVNDLGGEEIRQHTVHA